MWFKRAKTEINAVVEGCNFDSQTIPFPRGRNFILDIMAEGRRQNTIYATMSVDVTRAMTRMAAVKCQQPEQRITLTGFVTSCLARAVDEQKHMHALRKGKHERVVYEEVDIAIMVEREVDEYLQPVNYIIRGANHKPLADIQLEIREAATKPLGEDWAMNRVESFFWKCPRFLRKIFWWMSRRKPDWRKLFVGTVGLTSMGMFGTGQCSVLPITPTNLTVAVGSTEKRPAYIEGEICERQFLNLVVGVNHDLIDGGPLMRFVSRFKECLGNAELLPNLKTTNYQVAENPQFQLESNMEVSCQ